MGSVSLMPSVPVWSQFYTQLIGLASWTDGDGAIEVCTHGLGLCTTSIDVVMSRLSHNLTLRKMGNQWLLQYKGYQNAVSFGYLKATSMKYIQVGEPFPHWPLKKRFIKMWNLTRLAYISMIKLHLVINIEQTSKIACLSHSLFCLSCILFFSFTKGLDNVGLFSMKNLILELCMVWWGLRKLRKEQISCN